jgi:N-alpha-acetyl-L-2,4-diaminobutyrate deacetylase
VIDNPISATIDFDADGIQHGFLSLPHSRNDSAWGAILTPVTQMKHGSGPTALLTGGNHGDEYEGPIALYDFCRRPSIDDLRGRVIVVPAMNYPAFRAGLRLSPVDGLNLNRSFPGNPAGTVTEIIADYFTRTLVPMADAVLDIHSGGRTLDFLPFAAIHRLDDKQLEARSEGYMRAFGAPYQLKMLDMDAQRMYDTQVESQGKVFVTTELGGAGTATPRSVAIAKRGVANFLKHAGILAGDLELPDVEPVSLDMPDSRSFLISEHAGLLEPLVALGDEVDEGEPLARVHAIERTAGAQVEYRAPRDGVVLSRHVPSLIKMGDCMFVIAARS